MKSFPIGTGRCWQPVATILFWWHLSNRLFVIQPLMPNQYVNELHVESYTSKWSNFCMKMRVCTKVSRVNILWQAVQTRLSNIKFDTTKSINDEVPESVQENLRQSIPHPVQELYFSQTSTWWIWRRDLGLDPFKIQLTLHERFEDMFISYRGDMNWAGIFSGLRLHPYKIQLTLQLKATDYKQRRLSADWALEDLKEDPSFGYVNSTIAV